MESPPQATTQNNKTACVRISRARDSGAGCRKFGLWIDGVKLPDKLGCQHDVVVPVTPNEPHTFQARLDWERSKKKPFTVMAGQEVHWEVHFGRWFTIRLIGGKNNGGVNE